MCLPSQILLVDTHCLLHRAITQIISNQKQFELLNIIQSWEKPKELLKKASPDILLMNYCFIKHQPTQELELIRKIDPTIKIVLIFNGVMLAHLPKTLFEANISAAISIEDSEDCLLNALSAAKNDSFWLSPRLNFDNIDSLYRLTNRETSILALLVQEKTDFQIAKILKVSERTIQNHLQRIYKKLGVCTRTGAAYQASKQQLLP